MRASPIVLIVAVMALVGHAQTPLFQVLDGPLPQQAWTANAVGDLDGDGDQDLTGFGAAFVNDGHGRFTAVPVPGLAFPRYRSVLVDVNGDGFLDMVSSTFAGPMRIDLGVAAITFVASLFPLPALTPPLTSVHNFAVGDVDLDGDADILIAPFQTYSVAPPVLWLNDGLGQFSLAPAGSLPVLNLHGTHLLLRDLDNDGDPDAIFASASNTPAIRVLLNTGGTFSAAPAWQWGAALVGFDVGDFDGDGLTDLAYSDGSVLKVVRNSGQGLVSGGALNNVSFDAIRAIDVNGDGVDEIVAQGANSIGLSLHAVSSVPPAVGPAIQSWPANSLLLQGPSHETVRDLDGDGDRDLVAQVASQPLLTVLMMNDGAGGLVRTGGRVQDIVIAASQNVGDLDGDGDVDVLGIGGATSSLVTGLNDGDGFLTAGAPSFTWPTSGYYVFHTFDRDGDGDLDIFGLAFLPGAPGVVNDVVYDNSGGTFTQIATVPGNGDGRSFQAADFDGDGDQDVLIGQFDSGSLPGPMTFLRNLGAAGFAAPVAVGVSAQTYDLDVADFDGNGTLDAFQTNDGPATPLPPGPPSVLFLNSGSGAFTPLPQAGLGGYFTAAGDLDGNGLPDLVIDGQVWFNAGGTSFIPGPALPSALVAAASLVDVDLDGDLDLVETRATVMLNAGGGVFGPPQPYLPRQLTNILSPQIPESAVVDLDKDGDPDIVAPGPIIFMNTTRQIAHGSIARPGRPASIDLYGTPSGAWFLWGSNGTASLPLPPWGTVFIDPASAQLGAMGQFAGPTAPLPGTASLSVLVPNNPALVGWTTYWQAAEASQMRFTNRITITVMGY